MVLPSKAVILWVGDVLIPILNMTLVMMIALAMAHLLLLLFLFYFFFVLQRMICCDVCGEGTWKINRVLYYESINFVQKESWESVVFV